MCHIYVYCEKVCLLLPIVTQIPQGEDLLEAFSCWNQQGCSLLRIQQREHLVRKMIITNFKGKYFNTLDCFLFNNFHYDIPVRVYMCKCTCVGTHTFLTDFPMQPFNWMEWKEEKKNKKRSLKLAFRFLNHIYYLNIGNLTSCIQILILHKVTITVSHRWIIHMFQRHFVIFCL